jgi:TRAP-type C4-dicarboxylate transport system permease small subunit
MITLFMTMSLITADVIMRSLLGKPILGAYELVQFFMVILIFFALPYTAFKDSHVTVDFFYDRFPKRTKAVINSIAMLFSFAMWVLVCWQSVVQGIFIYQSKQTTLALRIPVYGFLFVVACGCALLCLVLLTRFVQSLTQVGRNRPLSVTPFRLSSADRVFHGHCRFCRLCL